MRISAKADYAVRAAAELAAVRVGTTLKAEYISISQDIPPKFLMNILAELKHAGLVESHRGMEGGYALGRPAESITLADVIRAVEGPLATVQDVRPENLRYRGPASGLQEVWIAVRSSLRSVLEEITLADLISRSLPRDVARLVGRPEAWRSRSYVSQPKPPSLVRDLRRLERGPRRK